MSHLPLSSKTTSLPVARSHQASRLPLSQTQEQVGPFEGKQVFAVGVEAEGPGVFLAFQGLQQFTRFQTPEFDGPVFRGAGNHRAVGWKRQSH